MMNSLLNALSGLLRPDPDSFLFKDEKINTVIVVLVIIWAIIAGYMYLAGRKISKLEKELDRVKESRGSGGQDEGPRIEVQNNRS